MSWLAQNQALSDEDDEADVLESAIDLFSLLSFVLIAAALLFGASQGDSQAQHSAVLTFGYVERSPSTTSVPRGSTVLVVTGSGEYVEIVSKTGGESPKTLWTTRDEAVIEDALHAEETSMTAAESIALTIDGVEGDEASGRLRAFYRVQAWCSMKGIDANVYLN